MGHCLVSRLCLGGLLAVMVMVETACTTNPYTGRWQFLAIPAGYETSMGEQSYAQVLNDPKNPISHEPREVDPVMRVAERIIQVAKRSKYEKAANEYKWEVSVIKADQTANAFALPGGKIAVYTGLFPIAKNEAGLAAVMGHEVVHALARHGGERMSQGVATQLAMIGAAIGLGSSGMSGYTGQLAMQALGLGAQVGVLLPFSRKHESEADYIGLLFAAEAGYDPREAVRVWERMEAAGGQQPSEFLSTHPSHGTRIKQLTEWMPEALALYESAPKAPVAELPPIGRR
ncbi:MAG TPA: M48 family metallopeptidase [Nitrospiraceae bacterium]|nr:M48 family metallopeptidase [Nitrospiraceae bacterium]